MSQKRACILVVDDLEANRDALARMLTREAFLVETADNGEQALELLRRKNFDAVLLDVMMPQMDGIQALRAIKQDEVLRDLPVIMLSAVTEVQAIRECIELGADDYLPKPVDRALLRARLSSCLRRKHFQDQERLYRRELEANHEALKHLSHQRNLFLASAAHDLKNPLTTVLIRLDQMTAAPDQEEGTPVVQRHVQSIRESVDRMLNLIQAILDTAAQEAGTQDIRKSPVDLSRVMRQVLEENRAYASSKDLRLHFSPGCPEELEMQLDPHRIREVVDNLVNNAIKFSPRGREVEVTLLEGKDRVEIRVRDQGPGLTEEDKKQVFSPYQRLSARPTGNEISTGLGLSIVKHVVEHQGGRVFVESEAGQGATFIVEFPRSVPDGPAES